MVSPEGTSRADFMEWVEALHTSGPRWLGLPPTAELQLLQDEGVALLSKVLVLQDTSGDDDDDSAYRVVVDEDEEEQSSAAESGGGPAWMGVLVKTCEAWLAVLPAELLLLATDGAEASSAVYRFYSREVGIGSRTLTNLRRDLTDVIAVCNGVEKPTQLLREVIASLNAGTVPKEWASSYTVAPLLTAGQWVTDFKRRVEQLELVVTNGVSRLGSTGVWLGGLFAPEAYLMALRQVVAAKNKWSLEEVALEVHINVVKETLAELADGFIVHGMTLEGATWSSEEQQLQLSGDIAYPLENATLSWVNRSSLPDRERITVPVYLNRNRVEMLFTVDLAAPLATVPKSVWSQRGLALVAWSNSI
jgi:dynein heavy chain 1